MVVIKDILKYSAISSLPNGFKGLAIAVFACIASLLFVMLYWIFAYGDNIRVSFG
ncbi:MAG: hypothetical protein R2814_00115 [Flavobacteriaceae bacterium]